jgi:hypothetical protein
MVVRQSMVVSSTHSNFFWVLFGYLWYTKVESKNRLRKLWVLMSEEKEKRKKVNLEFATDSELPMLFVNTVNVRPGLDEFYLTFGTAVPLEVKNAEELESIDTIEARPYFRCAVTRTVMRQFIELMESVYNQQSQQIDALNQSQEQEGEDA